MTTSELIYYYTEESDPAFGFTMRSSYSDLEFLGFDSLVKNCQTATRLLGKKTTQLLISCNDSIAWSSRLSNNILTWRFQNANIFIIQMDSNMTRDTDIYNLLKLRLDACDKRASSLWATEIDDNLEFQKSLGSWFCYKNPYHHRVTNVIVANARVTKITAWAYRTGILIVEHMDADEHVMLMTLWWWKI